MRKYPPHCPRPSTNSPIHPRADSTLQPAAAAALPSSRSTIQRPSLTELPLCLPSCLPARPSVTPASLQSQGRRLSASRQAPFFLISSTPKFSSILYPRIFVIEQCNRLSHLLKIFLGRSLKKNARSNSEMIDISLADKTNVLSKKISFLIVSVGNCRLFKWQG